LPLINTFNYSDLAICSRGFHGVALARSIVALGHSLNLNVIAKGVETPEQKELLTSIGCDEMQGYLYCAPKTAGELAGLLGDPDQSPGETGVINAGT